MRTETRAYFAYGSNLLKAQMAARCPSHAELGVALLKGHRVVIGGRGYATIIPDSNFTTWGVVYILTQEDERALDLKEGVRTDCYRKHHLTTHTLDGDAVECLIYIEPNYSPGVPTAAYLKRILDGAAEHKLPIDYQKYLLSLGSTE